MKRVIKGTTGHSTSTAYVKERLFDYLADYCYLDIGGYDAKKVVDAIQDLRPFYDVDDVIALADEEGIEIYEAAKQLFDEM